MSSIWEIIPFAMALVVGGTTLAIGAEVVGGLNLDGDGALVAGNVTNGLLNYASQMPLVGTVGGLALVLMVLLGAFGAYMVLTHRE